MGRSQGKRFYDWYEDKLNRTFHGIIAASVAIVLIVLAIVCSGCKTPCPCAAAGTNTQHSETNDSVHTEYVHDSIYIDRWHKEYVKGDTVFVRDSVFRDRWHYKQLHDSIYIASVDTITNTITVEVEKKGSAFWRGSGIALWVLIGCMVLGVIIGIIIKIAKK